MKKFRSNGCLRCWIFDDLCKEHYYNLFDKFSGSSNYEDPPKSADFGPSQLDRE